MSGVPLFVRPTQVPGIYYESFLDALKFGDLVVPVRRIQIDSVVPTDGPHDPVGPVQTFTFIEDPPGAYDLPHTD